MVMVTVLSSIATFHISNVNTHHKQEPKIGQFNKVLHESATYALKYYFYTQMHFNVVSVSTQKELTVAKLRSHSLSTDHALYVGIHILMYFFTIVPDEGSRIIRNMQHSRSMLLNLFQLTEP
jgi:hypothetical protein